MVHLESIIKRNSDAEMHAASRVPGFRGAAIVNAIKRKRTVGGRDERSPSRRGIYGIKKR